MAVSGLHVGERVERADGTTATIVSIYLVPGAAAMWDLTVSRVHMFAVGAGAYVVHNCGSVQEAADTEAKALGKLVNSPWWARPETTVGVGYLQDAEGGIRRMVSVNAGALEKWGGRILAAIDPSEWVTGALPASWREYLQERLDKLTR